MHLPQQSLLLYQVSKFHLVEPPRLTSSCSFHRAHFTNQNFLVDWKYYICTGNDDDKNNKISNKEMFDNLKLLQKEFPIPYDHK